MPKTNKENYKKPVVKITVRGARVLNPLDVIRSSEGKKLIKSYKKLGEIITDRNQSRRERIKMDKPNSAAHQDFADRESSTAVVRARQAGASGD